MSRVLTPNVFITNNADIANEFFLTGKYLNVGDLPPAKDALVISGKNNKYLNSLEYSVNFDNENNPSLTLEFLDTDGNFEQNMFMHLINMVKGSLTNVFRKDVAKNPQQFQTSGSGGATAVITGSTVGVEENALTAIEQHSYNYKRIFVAFGTDNNLSNWSDLLTFYLQKTNIDVSNGLRRYIFKFYASNESIFRPKLKFNFEDPNYLREFLYLDALDRLLVTIPKNNNKDTLENILYRLVLKYLSVITNTPQQNIIGIIPKYKSSGELEGEARPIFTSNRDVIPSFVSSTISPSLLVFETNFRLRNIRTNLNRFGIKEANSNSELSLITQRAVRPLANAPINSGAVDITAERSASTSTIDSYMLICDQKDGAVNPAFPNFYDALNKIDKGIKSLLNTVDDFVIIQENNYKLIKFWQSKGLISNKLDKCIIFGPQQMISEYLYRNYISDFGDTTSPDPEAYLKVISKDFKGTLPIYDQDDPLYSNTLSNPAKIVLNNNYGFDLINTMSKKKISSNFYEQINLDELALDNKENQTFVDLFKTKGGIFELFEIPVFLNNFTNSNILNIQFQNSEVYLQGISLAIESNFAKAYLGALANNVNQVNIQGLNLSSVFDSYKELLKDVLGTTYTGYENITFKEILKTILVQQFYLAKDSGLNFIDKGEFKAPLFTQLANVKPKLRLSKTRFETITYIDNIEGELSYRQALPETQEELEARVLEETGNKFFVDGGTVENVLNYFKTLGGLGFDKLIYQSLGNINLDTLLFSIAASKLQNNKTRFALKPVNASVGFSIELVEPGGFELSKQEAYFNLANTMFTLFDIQTLDDDKGLKDGMVFKPKNFGLSQENIAAELWKSLNKQHTILNIKTLPFFHMSSLRLFNFKPCFVFSKQVTPVNINSTDNSSKLDFFSGVYNITAFKHVINTKECYSQFGLAKNLGNSYAL
jgi:hypothetical protein